MTRLPFLRTLGPFAGSVLLTFTVMLAATTAACAGSDDGLSDDQAQEIERLKSLGYLAGVSAGPIGGGVVVYDRALAQQGLNLYNIGGSPEAILMSMNGEVLHRWYLSYEDAFPERAAAAAKKAPGVPNTGYWRRVYLYPNGDVLAIFEGRGGLIKVDKDSNLLWAMENGAHHEVTVAADGLIYLLTRTAHVVPEINPDRPILEDFISVLDANGDELQRKSVIEALRDSDYAHLLEGSAKQGDFVHTNTLKVLGDNDAVPGSSVFRAGNILTSFRRLDAIAVIDLSVNRVVWALGGIAEGQHDPTLLADGNILMFDNRRSEEDGSRVIEIDPSTGEVLWQYPEGQADLYSECCGTSQRLPNGNTLMTFTGPGIALEVTPRGNVVWEFENPHRTGPNDELIAQLMEVRRLPLEYVREWFDQ